jgi:signal transduction histidine kinase
VKRLDGLPSIRLRIGVVIVAGIGVSGVVALVVRGLGASVVVSALAGMVVALVIVQLLARGMTRPLREMAVVSREMAHGRHGAHVAGGHRHDEVGELARAFNTMSAELAETDRQRRDIVANVAHELRTPISALQAKLENVADGVEQPDPETIETMLLQVQRLGRLVEQLLDLSRLESQAQPFELRPFGIGDVLESVAREARLHTPEGVELTVVADAAIAVRGDAERVHQVVLNLVENAIRHSPRPGRVSMMAATCEPGRVRIEILDEGPGIPDADADRVFERFYRADRARSGDAGAGLGLAIARWIVDLHGGEIRAERGEPSGCRMVVELPAAA